MTLMSGWGRYPTIDANCLYPEPGHVDLDFANAIPYGAGRSYGDSALASTMLVTEHLNRFISFDEKTGLLTCGAGVTLADILASFVPRGWFLQVTPGTKFVTVGGAIASDVHGKNHHIDGCFSESVRSVLLSIQDEQVRCSPKEHAELFHATCGGMGLTGLIIEATIQLRPIESAWINQKTIKAANLGEVLSLFELHLDALYSVAWIDCLADGENIGRSILTVGEHAKSGSLEGHRSPSLNVPFTMPAFSLNPFTVKAFNELYYLKAPAGETHNVAHYNDFFYPLDGVNNWNRMYGKPGFTQYQFVIPKTAGLEGVTRILKEIAKSKQGSFLAVLKVFGKQNQNLLSFPMEGYTLALDFKVNKTVLTLLAKLDEIVAEYNGRVYLAKDARMSEQFFKKTYSNWEQFQAIREKYGALERYQSMQSQRLGL